MNTRLAPSTRRPGALAFGLPAPRARHGAGQSRLRLESAACRAEPAEGTIDREIGR